MKPIHYILAAGAAALILAGGSSKAPAQSEGLSPATPAPTVRGSEYSNERDALDDALNNRLRKSPQGPIQITPNLTYDVHGMDDRTKALMVVGYHLHSKICTTKAPDVLVKTIAAIIKHSPPSDVEFNRAWAEARKDADGKIGEWCRAISASFKAWGE